MEQRRFSLLKRVLLKLTSEFSWSIDFRYSGVFPSVLLRIYVHLLTYSSWWKGNQFNVLSKGNEHERDSASKMILATLFCSLKMLFGFSLDVQVQMFAPYIEESVWWQHYNNVFSCSLSTYRLIYFNRPRGSFWHLFSESITVIFKSYLTFNLYPEEFVWSYSINLWVIQGNGKIARQPKKL